MESSGYLLKTTARKALFLPPRPGAEQPTHSQPFCTRVRLPRDASWPLRGRESVFTENSSDPSTDERREIFPLPFPKIPERTVHMLQSRLKRLGQG